MAKVTPSGQGVLQREYPPDLVSVNKGLMPVHWRVGGRCNLPFVFFIVRAAVAKYELVLEGRYGLGGLRLAGPF